MPLNLDPKCKARLIDIVSKGLPKIRVDYNMFLNQRSYLEALLPADDALPRTGRLREQIISFTDDNPVTEFISESLHRTLAETQSFQSDSRNVSLTTLSEFSDPVRAAVELMDSFESLPWEYALTIRLPYEIGNIFSSISKVNEFGENLRVVQADEAFQHEYPRKSEDPRRNKRIYGETGLSGLASAFYADRAPTEWHNSGAYLQIRTQGFVGVYGKTVPVLNAESLVRAFCGLGIALRVFKVGHSYGGSPAKNYFLVHRREEDAWAVDGTIEMGSSHSTTFDDLRPHDLDGDLLTDARKIGWTKHHLDDFRAVFSNSPKSEKLVLAAQWLFDSHVGRDELLGFIQTMVVLEILLGDKAASDEIGLGELLRSRCAYLIGISHRQRSEILDDFNKIYQVRSQIVHRGKSRLTADERSLFGTLRWMCSRVISEEIRLLKKDLEAG